MKNKKMIVISLITVFIVACIGLATVVGTYNGLATSKNNVDKSWSDVETSYQRRADLIVANNV